MPCGRGQNKTPPVADTVLQPMLAAASYLVDTLGPHAIELITQVRDADLKWSYTHGNHVLTSALPEQGIAQLLVDYERRGEPLPMAAEHTVRDRLAAGWSPEDPLTPISLGLLARQAGFSQFWRQWIPHLRDRIEATLSVVGAEKPFGRNASAIVRADGDGTHAWTLPLARLEAVAVVGVVRTAAIVLLAAVSGMRSSELMELVVGCCRPPEHYGPELVRYRLASKVIKGQQLGGITDEWVVIEPVYRAAQLLEQLHDNPNEGMPLLGRFAFDVRYKATSRTPATRRSCDSKPTTAHSASGSPRPSARSTNSPTSAHKPSRAWPPSTRKSPAYVRRLTRTPERRSHASHGATRSSAPAETGRREPKPQVQQADPSPPTESSRK